MTVALTTIRFRRGPGGALQGSRPGGGMAKKRIPSVIRLTSTHQFPILCEYLYFS
jgi:hypothetical protein